MPVERCFKDGKPGYRYGKKGVCYVYELGNKQSHDQAKAKAEKQGQAIKASGYKE